MLIMTNVDNINTDQIPYLIEQLLETGAANVHVLPALTKKGRQEFIILIDTPPEQVDTIKDFIAGETGSLGIRTLKADHMSLDYRIHSIDIALEDETGHIHWQGSVKVKLVLDAAGKILSARAEYEDIKSTAKMLAVSGFSIGFLELKQRVEIEALKRFRQCKYRLTVL